MNAKDELLKSLCPQIINHFAGLREISLEESTDLFYKSKTFIDAQDRFLIEFGGNFTVLYKCIDILEEYYNEKSNINETA